MSNNVTKCVPYFLKFRQQLVTSDGPEPTSYITIFVSKYNLLKYTGKDLACDHLVLYTPITIEQKVEKIPWTYCIKFYLLLFTNHS